MQQENGYCANPDKLKEKLKGFLFLFHFKYNPRFNFYFPIKFKTLLLVSISAIEERKEGKERELVSNF